MSITPNSSEFRFGPFAVRRGPIGMTVDLEELIRQEIASCSLIQEKTASHQQRLQATDRKLALEWVLEKANIQV